MAVGMEFVLERRDATGGRAGVLERRGAARGAAPRGMALQSQSRVASATSSPDAASALEPYVLTTPLYYLNDVGNAAGRCRRGDGRKNDVCRFVSLETEKLTECQISKRTDLSVLDFLTELFRW
ncbi:unnamed protein product [Urochloa humidicola]